MFLKVVSVYFLEHFSAWKKIFFFFTFVHFHFLHLFILYLFIVCLHTCVYVCVCVHACECVCIHAMVDICKSADNLGESGFFPLPCGSLGLNPGHQALWQMPLPSELSLWSWRSNLIKT